MGKYKLVVAGQTSDSRLYIAIQWAQTGAIEAKSNDLQVGEGVAHAKNYAQKLQLETTFAANGKEIYRICMKTGKECLVTSFPTPQELWDKTFAEENSWRDQFDAVPLEGHFTKRFYQEIAINNIDVIAKVRKEFY